MTERQEKVRARWLHETELRHGVAERLSGFDRRSAEAEGLRRAAVCVSIVPDARERACFVLTIRGSLKRHGGQFALPGGRLDPGETATEAALRELEEEVGIRAAPSDVLGFLDDVVTRSGFRITPLVVWHDALEPLRPAPGEVAEAFRVPLAELARPDAVEDDEPGGHLSLRLLDTLIFAPTAAVLYQFREVALHGRACRVDAIEQPPFAWK